jgi:hypothetical protein
MSNDTHHVIKFLAYYNTRLIVIGCRKSAAELKLGIVVLNYHNVLMYEPEPHSKLYIVAIAVNVG